MAGETIWQRLRTTTVDAAGRSAIYALMNAAAAKGEELERQVAEPDLARAAESLAVERDKEIEWLREDLKKWKSIAFSPLGDNHHNAAACPHCNPTIEKMQRQFSEMRSALAAAQVQLTVEIKRTETYADLVRQMVTLCDAPDNTLALDAVRHLKARADAARSVEKWESAEGSATRYREALEGVRAVVAKLRDQHDQNCVPGQAGEYWRGKRVAAEQVEAALPTDASVAGAPPVKAQEAK